MTVRITSERQGRYTTVDVAFQKVQANRYFLRRYGVGGWSTMSVIDGIGIDNFLSANAMTKIYAFSDEEKEGIYRPAPQGAQHQSQPSQ